MTDLQAQLEKQASLYDNGEELTSDGILEGTGWRFFDCQINLVKKTRHLHEFESDSETARKAMMIGLNMLAAPYIDDETAANLSETLQAAQAGGE